MSNTILVFGAGSWGTALAIQLAYVGNNVYLHSWKNEHNKEMMLSGVNNKYLSEVNFPNNMQAVINWESIINECSDILIATPSKGFADILSKIKPYIKKQGIISATKGFCHKSYKLFDQVCNEIIPSVNFCVITGPSFAKEVANKMPTAILSASENQRYAVHVQNIFSSSTFRCYTSNDVIGAQIGGAVKNVLAIACGISDGLKFGANARSALITRGLKEIIRLGVKLGANVETFNGLSGIGDLILTCTDNQSRNRSFGFLLGQGYTQVKAIEEVNQVVEGILTTKSVYELAQSNSVYMPITTTVYKILYNDCDLETAVRSILNSDLKPEL